MGPLPFVRYQDGICGVGSLSGSWTPQEFEQWNTFWGARAFITNVVQAGVNGLLGGTMGLTHETRFGCIVWSPTRFGFLFHVRSSQESWRSKKKETPVTIDNLWELSKILEGMWQRTNNLKVKRCVAEMGVWFVAGLCTGLRGKEKLLIEFAGTARSLKFLADSESPHFILVILGRTKGM